MLLWMDGFDRYGAAADLTASYYTAQTGLGYSAVGGVYGGGAATISGSGSGLFDKSNFSGSALTLGGVVHVACFYKIAGSTATNRMLEPITNAGVAGLDRNSDGSLNALRHGDQATLVTTEAGMIPSNSWVHVELAAKYNSSANGGFVKVWVNGNLVINFSGTTISGSAPTSYTGIRLRISQAGQTGTYDDLVCWDESGTDFVFTQLGASYAPSMDTLDVDADDAVQFTPLSGANFQNIDETAYHDSDTTYNESNTVGHEDLFTLESLPVTAPAVYGVILKTVAKVDIPGVAQLRTKISSNAVVNESSNKAVSALYLSFFDVYGKNPDGTVDWTESTINALKVGYKYQAAGP